MGGEFTVIFVKFNFIFKLSKLPIQSLNVYIIEFQYKELFLLFFQSLLKDKLSYFEFDIRKRKSKLMPILITKIVHLGVNVFESSVQVFFRLKNTKKILSKLQKKKFKLIFEFQSRFLYCLRSFISLSRFLRVYSVYFQSKQIFR